MRPDHEHRECRERGVGAIGPSRKYGLGERLSRCIACRSLAACRDTRPCRTAVVPRAGAHGARPRIRGARLRLFTTLADTRGINPGGTRPTHVWCRTVYFVSLSTHRLASFWTDSPSFRTVNGSHPGMRQRIADGLERHHAYGHALTGISDSTRSADLFIENIGCKSARPGGDPERTPCLGGHVRSLIVEGRHPVGLLRDLFPTWNH